MSVDPATVKKIARLARIRVDEAELPALADEVNGILHFVEQLQAVDVAGVEPLASVVHRSLPLRDDVITDGGDAERVLANAPNRIDSFFTVPKVVE
ncbi:Asp-tRNA(Asn)/Glu-tRNA(Gln) amidotransferase subunit GatC [Zavarzinia compransoris]|uniref:Aspartyl/glutamyl-tRNA(Asn/Gln) amidotransferase subunit C n=1 Tax=Zavarzinia compransoris TaxID=1264899 RepID=A0A317E947_9PROT|nr:Asp-tRNA(Asn)/Glu-tRNA(Gln) amidotransferase subunit GatC [Zavarzinia compransoris]PWR23102.1 Asp-tRNA(Asn)/Glu-tRNA(Gln) amidotransferase GatCAB subunit C [Zavarzinia compransoris]TDP46348.1 aspartyl/glutamyl-tRNA(Asn/Gln) amidotransferase subunit C [Zavarzinia compransoris]